jgi:hypothetical protein
MQQPIDISVHQQPSPGPPKAAIRLFSEDFMVRLRRYAAEHAADPQVRAYFRPFIERPLGKLPRPRSLGDGLENWINGEVVFVSEERGYWEFERPVVRFVDRNMKPLEAPFDGEPYYDLTAIASLVRREPLASAFSTNKFRLHASLRTLAREGALVLWAHRDDPRGRWESISGTHLERGFSFRERNAVPAARHHQSGCSDIWWYDLHCAFTEDLAPKLRSPEAATIKRDTSVASREKMVQANERSNRVIAADTALESEHGKSRWHAMPVKGKNGRAKHIRDRLGELTSEGKPTAGFSDENINTYLKAAKRTYHR